MRNQHILTSLPRIQEYGRSLVNWVSAWCKSDATFMDLELTIAMSFPGGDQNPRIEFLEFDPIVDVEHQGGILRFFDMALKQISNAYATTTEFINSPSFRRQVEEILTEIFAHYFPLSMPLPIQGPQRVISTADDVYLGGVLALSQETGLELIETGQSVLPGGMDMSSAISAATAIEDKLTIFQKLKNSTTTSFPRNGGFEISALRFNIQNLNKREVTYTPMFKPGLPCYNPGVLMYQFGGGSVNIGSASCQMRLAGIVSVSLMFGPRSSLDVAIGDPWGSTI